MCDAAADPQAGQTQRSLHLCADAVARLAGVLTPQREAAPTPNGGVECSNVKASTRATSAPLWSSSRFCQISGHAGLGEPHPRNGEGTLLACPDCASTATTRRKGRTALGSRRFRCQACRRRFHERTGTPFNDLQDPTDSVLLAVLSRLRYKLGFRDVAALLLQRGFEVTHEPIRAWEVRFAPRLADPLRAKRRGQAGGSWYLDETDVQVAGRWCSRERALDREGVLLDSRRSAHRDTHAARRFLRRLVEVTERTPPRVTTDQHPPYRSAIRWILGRMVVHRTHPDLNHRTEQDHRAVKQR